MNTQTQKNNDPTMKFAVETWQKMVADQMERLQTLAKEVERHEKSGLEQAGTAIDELVRLMKDSLAQTSRLSTEWRQMALEATQRAGEMIGSTLGKA
jgi:hypothetical protein